MKTLNLDTRAYLDPEGVQYIASPLEEAGPAVCSSCRKGSGHKELAYLDPEFPIYSSTRERVVVPSKKEGPSISCRMGSGHVNT